MNEFDEVFKTVLPDKRAAAGLRESHHEMSSQRGFDLYLSRRMLVAFSAGIIQQYL